MMNDEQVPFDVVDYEIEDLSQQTGQDVIDAAQNVRMTVHKKSSVKLSKDKCIIKFNLGGQIGPLGVDGNGKYSGKVIWMELIAGFTPEGKLDEKYSSDWWQKTARFGYKTFIKAMGYDEKNPPRLNDEFLQLIAGREFIGSITKPEMTVRNDEGKYKGTGEYKNEISNIKKAE